MSGDHNHIEVRWEVADGYLGKSRPQTTRIKRADIEGAGSEEDVREIVEAEITLDFVKKVSADYGEDVYAEALELWRESQKEDGK